MHTGTYRFYILAAYITIFLEKSIDLTSIDSRTMYIDPPLNFEYFWYVRVYIKEKSEDILRIVGIVFSCAIVLVKSHWIR